MSNIEPTEEQKQAVRAIAEKEGARVQLWHLDEIARLLAEREAKLREEVAELSKGWRAAEAELKTERLVAEKALAARNEMENERDAARRDLKQSKAMSEAARDTLRARVAELEAERGDTVGCEGCGKRLPSLCAVSTEDPVYLCARCVSPMHMERESQHLADIKALMAKRLVDMREAARWGAELAFNVDEHVDDTKIAADIMEEFATFDAEDEMLARLAHYDDAKAAEGGEG